jgi:hypothetical protein
MGALRSLPTEQRRKPLSAEQQQQVVAAARWPIVWPNYVNAKKTLAEGIRRGPLSRSLSLYHSATLPLCVSVCGAVFRDVLHRGPRFSPCLLVACDWKTCAKKESERFVASSTGFHRPRPLLLVFHHHHHHHPPPPLTVSPSASIRVLCEHNLTAI